MAAHETSQDSDKRHKPHNTSYAGSTFPEPENCLSPLGQCRIACKLETSSICLEDMRRNKKVYSKLSMQTGKSHLKCKFRFGLTLFWFSVRKNPNCIPCFNYRPLLLLPKPALHVHAGDLGPLAPSMLECRLRLNTDTCSS